MHVLSMSVFALKIGLVCVSHVSIAVTFKGF